MHFTLPQKINANGLLPFLVDLGWAIDTNTVTVDFTHLRRVSPAALAALACQVARWRADRRTVVFQGLDECPITGYLQRMDVLNVCGIE